MSIVTRSKDGDTLDTAGGQAVRLENVNTEESVHPDRSKNTAEGAEASKLSAAVVAGGDVTADMNSKDHFGRAVGTAKRTVNGVDIDMGFVQMTAGYSQYETRFGEQKDPALHNDYKEFFSDLSPYQYGELRQPLEEDEFRAIELAQVNLTKVTEQYNDGEATQEEFDAALFELHKDQSKVARFQHQKANWGQKIDPATMGTTDKESILFALQFSPEMAEQYNKATRNGHLSIMSRPEQEKTFWEGFNATYEQMAGLASLSQSDELTSARMNKEDYDIPVEEFTRGVEDPKFHTKILAEVDEYGEAAGLMIRDQIIEDIANNKVTDNMPLYAQVGYGALAMVADPFTYATGLGTGTLLKTAGKHFGMFQVANQIQGRLWTGSKYFTNSAKVASWAGAGMLEESIYALPQLGADHTFTVRDYGLTVAMGSAFGVGLGSVGAGVMKGVGKYRNHQGVLEARREEIRELDENINNPDAIKHTPQERIDADAAMAEVMGEKPTSSTKGGVSVKEAGIDTGPKRTKYTPWESINSISTKGFQKAARKVRDLFPKDSPMAILLNQQIGFNNNKANVKRSPELMEMSESINSEILHLASAYPDGNIPAARLQEIRDVMFTQKEWTEVDVFDQVLQGKTSNQTELLGQHIDEIHSHYEDGTIPEAMTEAEFITEFSDVINRDFSISAEDAFELTAGRSREVSLIHDMLDMNKLARESGDAEFTALVQKLNALAKEKLTEFDLASERLNELGLTDPTTRVKVDQPYKTTLRKRTGPEVLAEVRKDPELVKLMEKIGGLDKVTPESLAKLRENTDDGKLIDRLEAITSEELAEFELDNPNITIQVTKPFKKSMRKLSGPEIVAKLQEEGVVQYSDKKNSKGGRITTPEWKKRFSELRKEDHTLSPEVRQVGDLQSREVGSTQNMHDAAIDPDATPVHFSIDDAEKRMVMLRRKPDPTKEEIFEAKMLVEQIARSKQERITKLDKDAEEGPILTRKLKTNSSKNAFKDPTVESMEGLKKKLQAINKRNGSTTVPEKLDDTAKQRRLDAITKRMQKIGRSKVHKQVLSNGTFNDLVDVLRASDTLAVANKAHKERVAKQKAEKPETKAAPEQSAEAKATAKEVEADIAARTKKVKELETVVSNSEAKIQSIHDAVTDPNEKGNPVSNDPTAMHPEKVLNDIDVLMTKISGRVHKDAAIEPDQYKKSLFEQLDRQLDAYGDIEIRAAVTKAWKKRATALINEHAVARTKFLEKKATHQKLVKVLELEKAKLEEVKAKADEPTPKVEEELPTTALTEEMVDTLEHAPETMTPDEKATAEKLLADAQKKVVEDKQHKVTAGLANFEESGEKRRFMLAIQPTGALDYVGRMLGSMTRGVGELFLDSKLTSAMFFGAKVTETGRGFGGNAKRAPSSAIITDATFKNSASKIVPQYRKIIDAYAQSKGKGAWGRMKARERSGETSEVVQQFNEDLFLVQSYRRQGKPIPKHIDKSVTDFADQWDYYMDANHNMLVDAGAAGFRKDRKVKHYIPHIWQQGKFRAAVTTHGKAKVISALARGYRSLETDASPLSNDKAREQAEKLFDDVMSDDFANIDQFEPTMDSRAKQRRDIDTTADYEGLKVMDLLETDVIGMGIKYSNRVAGWVGLAKGTDGLLSTKADINIFRSNMIEEATEKGVDPKKLLTMFDDTIDQLFGRPTANMYQRDKQGNLTKGLDPILRNMKDLAVLTRMGGLGSTQLIETGQVITRSVMNMFSDEKVASKLLAMGRGDKTDSRLIEEIQSISNITDDLEFLDRQTVHLDQATLHEMSKVRQMSLQIANKATGGDIKAEASRGLGKVTGYNAIRRAQSRVTQGSFILDIANHFTKGTGVMGNLRMADVGLTDTLGKNAALEKAFKTHAQFDNNGVLERLNIGDWDKGLREELQYAMIRDEAQQIQRTHVGELPPFMNKPMMALIFQFRSMPLVAQSKSMGRAMAFGDAEAVTGVLLNAALAGLVRYGKFIALGGAIGAVAGELVLDVPDSQQTQVPKYINAFGIFADMYDLVLGQDGLKNADGVGSAIEKVAGEIPVLGLMNDYLEVGKAGSQGDVQGMAESAGNLLPLSNTAIGEVMAEMLSKMLEMFTYHGQQAVDKVEAQEGPLDATEKRIVEVEGLVDGEYEDDKGVITSGVGQTGENIGKPFKETVAKYVKRTKGVFEGFDDFSEELQAELVQLTYRGDVKSSYKWVKHFNKGDYQLAATELLDNKDYLKRKADGDDGVTKRLEEASEVIAKQ